MKDEERWGIEGDSGGEISRGSFKPGARVFVYLDRQIKDEERWGIEERLGEIGKGWEKVGERLRNLYMGLWRSV